MKLNAEIAREVMTPGPYSISEDATPEQATAFLTDRGFGAAVVIDVAGRPLGVVTRTDLLIHARERQESRAPAEPISVREIMTPAVFSVRPETSLPSVVEQFAALNVHHLFVVDDSGIVVGVISPIDLLRKLS